MTQAQQLAYRAGRLNMPVQDLIAILKDYEADGMDVVDMPNTDRPALEIYHGEKISWVYFD